MQKLLNEIRKKEFELQKTPVLFFPFRLLVCPKKLLQRILGGKGRAKKLLNNIL